MYCLQNNVEIIAGANRYCIYDLNQQKMYSLDTEDVETLNGILHNSEHAAESLKTDVGRYLIQAGIIVDKSALLPKIKIPEYKFAIRFAWIEITQNCNLICRHCYEGSSRRECKPEITFDNFAFVIDELEKHGVGGIQLVGGEPLVHSQINKMIDYVAGKFPYIEIYTNGTLLTDALLDKIALYTGLNEPIPAGFEMKIIFSNIFIYNYTGTLVAYF